MSDVWALAQMRNFTRTDDLEFILLMVAELDRIYLEKAYAEREKKAKEAAKKKPTPGNRR